MLSLPIGYNVLLVVAHSQTALVMYCPISILGSAQPASIYFNVCLSVSLLEL